MEDKWSHGVLPLLRTYNQLIVYYYIYYYIEGRDDKAPPFLSIGNLIISRRGRNDFSDAATGKLLLKKGFGSYETVTKPNSLHFASWPQ